jgi:hypothetical protein
MLGPFSSFVTCRKVTSFFSPHLSSCPFFLTCETRQSTSELTCTTYRHFTAPKSEISRSVKFNVNKPTHRKCTFLIAQYHASAARLIAQRNKVENRARDDFRDLWDCGAGIKNAEVVAFRREPPRRRQRKTFRVRGRVTPRTIEVIIVQ